MATLKISELSVGDWVGVRCGTKINAFKVEEIRFNNIIHKYVALLNNKSYGLPTAELHPIPITAEILEANGFVRSTSQFIVYHTDKVWISYDKPSETWSVTMYINDVTSNLHANILHIHQLQHALRLAGVDKEINL